MPVKQSKIRWGYKSLQIWVFNWRRKVCSDDEMTVSGRPFQTWAAATGKARLPTVASLMGVETRRLVLADRTGCGNKKRPHYKNCYYSQVSLWIFILFASMETEVNTLQRSYKTHHFTLTVSPHYLVKLRTTKNELNMSVKLMCS